MARKSSRYSAPKQLADQISEVSNAASPLTHLAVDLSGDIYVTELSFNLESVDDSPRVLILTASQGRTLLLRRVAAA